MSVLIALSVGCTDKDDSDTETGTDVGDPAEPVSVSGEVFGLFNGDVVLQLNGQHDLTVDVDGAFSFEGEIVEGDAFDVTVLAEPTGQSCDVVAGAGAASTDVTDVQVVCECDFAAGRGDTRMVAEVVISETNALNFNAFTPFRGIDATLDWDVSCGSESHTLVQSSSVAPDLEGTVLEGSIVTETTPLAWSGTTAWARTLVQPSDLRGRLTVPVLYRASPPSWDLQAVLYAGSPVGSLTITQIDSVDVGSDGRVVSGVLVDDGVSSRSAVAMVNGDTLSVAYDSADGVDVDGSAQVVCRLGAPSWSAAGHMAVPVTYGSGCLFRGISDSFNGVLVVSDGQAARLILGEDDVDPVAGDLFRVADVATDDVGHAVLREWRCVEGQRCVNREGGTGLVQVDLETGVVNVVARYGEEMTDGVIVYGINGFDVAAATGDVAVHLGTEATDCRRGGCAFIDQVALWDGTLHPGLSRAEPLGDYVLDGDMEQVIATSGGHLGAVGWVWQGTPNNEAHDALMCWDAQAGGSVALGRATNDETAVDVNTVRAASINASGNFASIVVTDDEPVVMMLGSCL